MKGTSEDVGSVIRAMFTDDLLQRYNWEGTWDKHALDMLMLFNKTLRDVFQQQGALEFEKSVRNALERSHNRLLFALSIEALPTTSTTATTHIVSYVNQPRKATKSPNGGHDKFSEFDFENFRSNLTAPNPEMQGALQQLFGRFVENLETNSDNVDKDLLPKPARVNETLKDNEISYMQDSDDLMAEQANTLDNGFGVNEQHESQINETMWQRSKQSIPVLESVRHLVHSVRNGALNNTVHASPTRHHQLLGGDAGMDTMMSHNGSDPSTAIETEEDREMINGSNDLKFLEVLGSIGSRVWGFLSSLKQVFAASSGSASAALSAQSSSSSS